MTNPLHFLAYNDVTNLRHMWTLRQAAALLGYLFRARTPGQLHSPFLFDALRFVFDNQRQYYAFREIERVRKSLSKSPVQVPPNDLGAPSRKASARNMRTIGDVIRISTSSAFKCQCLFRLATYMESQVIVEIGAAAGISTAYLASSSPRAEIHTLEGHPVLTDHIARVAGALEIHNIRIHPGPFEDTLPALLQDLDHFDLAVIDGNHRPGPTIAYYHLLKEKHTDESIIVVDDIRWTEEMWRAWCEMRDDVEVAAALDMFSFGVLLFRRAFKDKIDMQILPRRWPPRVILQ